MKLSENKNFLNYGFAASEGRLTEAATYLEAVRVEARQCGDDLTSAFVTTRIARLYYRRDDFASSIQYFESACAEDRTIFSIHDYATFVTENPIPGVDPALIARKGIEKLESGKSNSGHIGTQDQWYLAKLEKILSSADPVDPKD